MGKAMSIMALPVVFFLIVHPFQLLNLSWTDMGGFDHLVDAASIVKHNPRKLRTLNAE